MKASLLLASKLCLFSSLLSGCVMNADSSAVIRHTKKGDIYKKEVGRATCQEWSGVWRTYEMPSGSIVKMCGDTPCEGENYAGVIKLECRDENIAGIKPLMFASFPPPGKEITAPLEIGREDGKLIMRHVNPLKCVVTYSVTLKGVKIIGEYFVSGCDDFKWRSKHGDFLAVKSLDTK